MPQNRIRASLTTLFMLATLAVAGCQSAGTAQSDGKPAGISTEASAPDVPAATGNAPAPTPDAKAPSKGDFCTGFRDFTQWASGDDVQGNILTVSQGAVERLTPLKDVVPGELAAELQAVLDYYSVFAPGAGGGGATDGALHLKDSMEKLAVACGL